MIFNVYTSVSALVQFEVNEQLLKFLGFGVRQDAGTYRCCLLKKLIGIKKILTIMATKMAKQIIMI